MKNLLLVVLLLTAATKAVAQWNQGSPFNTTTQVTNGNVGIGHTSPQSRLLVRTTIAHQGLVIANCDTNGNQSHFALTTADQARAGLATESYFNIYNSGKWMFNSGNTSGGTTLPISFSTDGVNRLYIKPDGNIGVGTATPWSPLTIEPGQLTLANNIGTNYTEVAALNFANRAISGAANSSNNARISVQTASSHFSSIMSFYVRSGAAAYEAMRILPDGSVGIGTTNPNSFKLAVEGKIGAREVNVTTANPWPDYVFEKNYNLPTLTELEAYIKVNKHLPEVPSACAVEENGVNLGEMNAILLKKVEELTLYLLEQNRISVEQQSEIEILKSELAIIKQNIK